VRYDLATGQKTVVLKPDWDVWGAGYSRNGTYLVVSINNDARTELRLFEAATMRPGRAAAAGRRQHHRRALLARREPHGLLRQRQPHARATSSSPRSAASRGG
jgi:hypothetical protein